MPDAMIRWMIRADLPTVLEIEQAGFHDDAWTEADFIDVLRRRNCIGLVIDRKEVVIAFVIYELTRTRLEVINMAVAPEWRCHGYGRMLLNRLRGKLRADGRRRVTAAVSEWNTNAHLFFRSSGFKAIGVLRDHFEPGSDAYEFEALIGESSNAGDTKALGQK